ncbi:MAG TPA: peptide chain release factor N(5)-glutamine methyltransferase [Terrimicrobiaceae bacterium]
MVTRTSSLLTAATGYLQNQGVESPRLNAEHLLARVLGRKRLDLYLEFDRPLSDAERAAFRELIRDRGKGKPLQHVLGTVEFFGRSFLSDARALIPRPETEQLVELVTENLRDRTKRLRILDIGTGSGVIAITLALELPLVSVVATEISPQALDLARENAARHSVKIDFHEANFFPSGLERFDCVVANLPYIESGVLAGLQREVQHDPPLALDGGPDGLSCIRRLIESAPELLKPDGTLALEIGHGQAAAVSAQLNASGYRKIHMANDYQGLERFAIATSPERSLDSF